MNEYPRAYEITTEKPSPDMLDIGTHWMIWYLVAGKKEFVWEQVEITGYVIWNPTFNRPHWYALGGSTLDMINDEGLRSDWAARADALIADGWQEIGSREVGGGFSL